MGLMKGFYERLCFVQVHTLPEAATPAEQVNGTEAALKEFIAALTKIDIYPLVTLAADWVVVDRAALQQIGKPALTILPRIINGVLEVSVHNSYRIMGQEGLGMFLPMTAAETPSQPVAGWATDDMPQAGPSQSVAATETPSQPVAAADACGRRVRRQPDRFVADEQPRTESRSPFVSQVRLVLMPLSELCMHLLQLLACLQASPNASGDAPHPAPTIFKVSIWLNMRPML